MATSGDFGGHQRLPQMATSGDFLMAMDSRLCHSARAAVGAAEEPDGNVFFSPWRFA
jgi:hypothetical protein